MGSGDCASGRDEMRSNPMDEENPIDELGGERKDERGRKRNENVSGGGEEKEKKVKAHIRLIDFGKAVPLPEGISIDHRSDWVEGNHEDGYLFGLENILDILEELLTDTPTHVFLPNDDTIPGLINNLPTQAQSCPLFGSNPNTPDTPTLTIALSSTEV